MAEAVLSFLSLCLAARMFSSNTPLIKSDVGKASIVVIFIKQYFFLFSQRSLKLSRLWTRNDNCYSRCGYCYHVNSTRSCTFIECSQPIRFFTISLMYKNSGFPAPLVVLNSMIKVVRFLKLPCSLCFVIPVNSQLVYRGSSIFRPQRLPLHSRPFPASPCLHVQLYDPFVLLQNAWRLQVCSALRHSLISPKK